MDTTLIQRLRRPQRTDLNQASLRTSLGLLPRGGYKGAMSVPCPPVGVQHTMAKQLFWANIRIPEHPRVRFFSPSPDGVQGFKDTTANVAKLVIEDPEEPTGVCHL